jgi:hypothetical protein
MEKLIGRFKTRAADGRVVEILQYVDVLDAGPTFGGPEHDLVEGMPVWRTVDGREVNALASDEFEVLDVPEPFRVHRI